MAVWPFARRTTYVNGSLPAIDADDLNAMQDAIIDLYGFTPIFGDGSDGAYAASSGGPIEGSNKYFTTVNLTGTVDFSPDAHIIQASQYIRLRGTALIDAQGAGAANNSDTHGTGAGTANQTLGNGANGGNGGVDGVSGGVGQPGFGKSQTSLGGNGGAGGNGDSGGAGGAGGVCSLNAQLETRTLINLLLGMLSGYNGSAYGLFPMQGGGGGGGGGSIGSPYNNDGLGGGGGGGVIVLAAPIIDIGAGCTISARGGAGASNTGSPGDWGGGGGGGGGGLIILLCSELIETGTVSAAGGAGGLNSGGGGTNGAAGSAGTIIRRVLF